ncbi:alpha/beta fold hydrolase [Glaciecola sp. SC05]|uniref:alpha/beta fold hydrolase n=1 Tax=Glaciecola sp. SC05 TaxID=1987355 RepID=UPI003528BFC5
MRDQQATTLIECSSTTKLTAHFAHANGFPAGSYQVLFKYLESELSLFALDKFAHNPKFPLNDNWGNQADELIDYVEQQGSGKVLAIGHSFGGVISYIACCKRPDLFNGLIMLDPPVAAGLARHIFRFAKSNRLIYKLTPARITQVRKQRWHKDEDLVKYFSSRGLFKDMDKRCVEDYIKSVTALRGDQRHLLFDRDIEANIFLTIPHNLSDYYGKLKCPATLITSRFTDVCVPRLRRPFLRNNPTMEHLELPLGGHMFPLEHPKMVAEAISTTINKWQL